MSRAQDGEADKPRMPEEAEMRDALRNSGYLLEYRAEQFLHGAGLSVSPGVSFIDGTENRAFEMDLLAMDKSIDLTEDKRNQIHLALVIECKNNHSPLALVQKCPKDQLFHIYSAKFAGYPAKAFVTEGEKQYWNHLANVTNWSDSHHYCSGPIATQFCAFNYSKKQQGTPEGWRCSRTLGNIDFSEALYKLNSCVEYFTRSIYSSWSIFSPPQNVNLTVFYPVLLISGDLVAFDGSVEGLPMSRVNRGKIANSCVVGGKTVRSIVDVVTEPDLPNYIEVVRKEVSELAQRLTGKLDMLHKSLNELYVMTVRAGEKTHPQDVYGT